MKSLKRSLVGGASVVLLILVGLAAGHVISGATLTLFAVMLALSVTVALVVTSGSEPQKSVASMLRDDVDPSR